MNLFQQMAANDAAKMFAADQPGMEPLLYLPKSGAMPREIQGRVKLDIDLGVEVFEYETAKRRLGNVVVTMDPTTGIPNPVEGDLLERAGGERLRIIGRTGEMIGVLQRLTVQTIERQTLGNGTFKR